MVTDLEKIERAKMYMDKLANGINPISGEEAPEDDIINNVRLSRCFFFVSDVLRQVLENGGVGKQKKTEKPTKIPFTLSYEQRKNYNYSDSPIPISEISRRISSLSEDENMSQMKYGSITGWLTQIGMMELSLSATGRQTKIPTSTGRDLGISTAVRTGMNGAYTAVLYNRNAQQFIIDNLDAVLEFERETMKLQGKPWSQEHDECLVDLFKKGVPESEIAITLKRNTSSIRARLKKLGYQK